MVMFAVLVVMGVATIAVSAVVVARVIVAIITVVRHDSHGTAVPRACLRKCASGGGMAGLLPLQFLQKLEESRYGG